MLRSEKFYNNRLQRYFDEHYGAYERDEYEDEVEYYVNPAMNQWKFYIPELGVVVILTCDDSGDVSEIRYSRDQ